MVNFIEVLSNYQAKNINKISAEIGKELETFNNNLTWWKKAKSCTGVVRISISPYKTKAREGGGATSVIVNPRNTTNANVSEEGHDVSEREEAIDTREGKRKRLTTNFNKNKNVVWETGESDSPPIKIKK